MNTGHHRAITLLIVAAIGVVILAVSLPDMVLQPGSPIPGAANTHQTSPDVPASEGKPARASFGFLIQSALALGFVALLCILFIGLIRRIHAKRLAQLAAALGLVLIALLLLPRIQPGLVQPAPEELFAESTPDFTFTTAPIGNPPAQLYAIVIGFLLIGALMTGGWLLRNVFRKPGHESALVNAVDAALLAINDGQNLQDVIIRCYLQMMQVLRDEKGIEREQSVTPREFETWLGYQGIHDTSIRHLTRLFERARYSEQSPDPLDEQAAIECLSAIRAYCMQGTEPIH